MKVLLIAQHIEPSDGWGTLARTTALGLVNRGHTVEVLLQKADTSLTVHQHTGLPSPLPLISNPVFFLVAAWKIWRRIRIFQPDIIHVLTEPYALAFPLIPRRSRHPWVITGCGTYTILPFTKRISAWLLRAVYTDTDFILAISHYTQQRICEEVRTQSKTLGESVEKKISVYTLGIESPKNLPTRTPHTEKRILFVGGVKQRKGVLEIIEACGKFKQQSDVEFHLDIVGKLPQDEYVELLKERITALSLDENVSFRGHVSAQELVQLYANADLFIMLSIPHGVNFEGYGLVFLEANAYGVPVIGPDSSGCTNAIANGKSGFTVDPQKPDAVAEKMISIFTKDSINPNDCRQWAKEHSVDRQAEETEDIYQNVLR